MYARVFEDKMRSPSSVPGLGWCCHLDAPHHISSVVLSTKSNGGRLNDRLARVAERAPARQHEHEPCVVVGRRDQPVAAGRVRDLPLQVGAGQAAAVALVGRVDGLEVAAGGGVIQAPLSTLVT